MKKWLTVLIACCGFFLSSVSNAAWVGKLDLTTHFQAIGLREVNDGQWLGGLGKNFYNIQKDGADRLHVGIISAWNAEHGNNLYGINLGVNLPGVIHDGLARLAPDLTASLDGVRWIGQLGNMLSVDFMGGYRPHHNSDVHDFGYGVGAYVTVPLDLIQGL